MCQIVDEVPAYIISRYPTYQAFQQALYTGEVIRDQYGRFHLREEFQPQPYYGYPIIYNAQPIEEQNMIEFDMFNIEGVRGYYKIDENGNKIRLVNAEDIARGAGLTRMKSFPTSREIKTEEYVRWSEINQYAQSRLPYLQQAGMNPILLQYIPEKIDKDSYIPIELAIQIISCADSDQAKLFQAIVSITIAREIDKMIENKYNEELKSLQGQINSMNRQLEEKDRITNNIHDYYREFNDTRTCFKATQIAKDYGLSAQLLNQFLHKLRIIYPVNGTWQLYQEYSRLGYLITKNENGTSDTYWTADGKWFIDSIMRQHGIEKGKDNLLIIEKLMNSIF